MTTPYARSADGGALKTTLHLLHLAAAAGYTTVTAIACAEAIKSANAWAIYFLAVGTFGTSFASSLVFCVGKGAVQTLGWGELPTVALAVVWWSLGFVLVWQRGAPAPLRGGAAVATAVVWALLGAVLHDRVIAGREAAKGEGRGGGMADGDRLAPGAEVEAMA